MWMEAAEACRERRAWALRLLHMPRASRPRGSSRESPSGQRSATDRSRLSRRRPPRRLPHRRRGPAAYRLHREATRVRVVGGAPLGRRELEEALPDALASGPAIEGCVLPDLLGGRRGQHESAAPTDGDARLGELARRQRAEEAHVRAERCLAVVHDALDGQLAAPVGVTLVELLATRPAQATVARGLGKKDDRLVG